MSNAATAMPGALHADRNLTVLQKVSFGTGQSIESAVAFLAGTFLLYYLTNVCGLDPTVAGAILFVSLAIDAIADPLIGSLSDRFRSRWGRRLPFMAVALPIVALSGWALFSIPTQFGNGVTVALALVANIVLRVSTSLYALPYSALTAELTTDYAERSSIAAYRALFNFVGAIACVLPAFQMIFDTPDKMNSSAAYSKLGVLLACVVLLSGIISIAGIGKMRIAVNPLHRLPPPPASFVNDVRDLFRNRSFVLLFICCLILLIVAGSFQALNLYVYTHFWHLTPAQAQAPVLALQAGFIVGIPAAVFIFKKLEKRSGIIVAIILLAAGQTIPPLLAHSGQFPSLSAVAALGAMNIIFGACSAIFFIGIQSMLADAIDEHEFLFETRCEGLYYSSIVFASKAAVGAGSLLAGLILSGVGLKGAEAGKQAAMLAAPDATLLGMLWGPGHGLLFLIGIPLLYAYRIDRHAHQRIIDALAQRRLRAA